MTTFELNFLHRVAKNPPKKHKRGAPIPRLGVEEHGVEEHYESVLIVG